MSRASRAKGQRGEHEVAAIFAQYGYDVRGLEGSGDHLCVTSGAQLRPLTIHSEVKRQERLQLWAWIAQAEAEAPMGTVPVVSFRRNRSPWYAAIRLETLAELLA